MTSQQMNSSVSLTSSVTHMCAVRAVCPIPPLPTMPTSWPSEPGTTSRRGRTEGEREEGKWKGGEVERREVEGREVEGSRGQKREGDGPSTLHTYRINLGVAWERGYTQCRHDIHTINVHRNKRCMHAVSVLNLSSFLKPWNPP